MQYLLVPMQGKYEQHVHHNANFPAEKLQHLILNCFNSKVEQYRITGNLSVLIQGKYEQHMYHNAIFLSEHLQCLILNCLNSKVEQYTITQHY